MAYFLTVTLDRLVGSTYFELLVEGAAQYFPAEGDNWNSPYIPASLEIDAQVVAVTRFSPDGRSEVYYGPGFIGPMEHGLPIPGVSHFDDLTDEEKARVEEYAWDLHREAS